MERIPRLNVSGRLYNNNIKKKWKIKMENKNKRYNFGGFSFAKGQYFNLQINIINNAGYGTNNTVEMGIELTPEERQELITVLIQAGQGDKE
jgi:hypothetical protein